MRIYPIWDEKHVTKFPRIILKIGTSEAIQADWIKIKHALKMYVKYQVMNIVKLK